MVMSEWEDDEPESTEEALALIKLYGEREILTSDDEINGVTDQATDKEYDFYNLTPSQIETIKTDLFSYNELNEYASWLDERFADYLRRRLDSDYLIKIVDDLVHLYVGEKLRDTIIKCIREANPKPMARSKRAKLIVRQDIEINYLTSAPKRHAIESIIDEIARKLSLNTQHVKTVVRRANSLRIDLKTFSYLVGVSVETIEKWDREKTIPRGRKVDGEMTWGKLDVHAVKHTHDDFESWQSEDCLLCSSRYYLFPKGS
jgi:DNA-binding transcriptional regulator YiaG